MDEGFDLVVGARNFSLKVMPFLRVFANSFSSFIVSMICGTRILDSQSGYRLLKAEIVKKLILHLKSLSLIQKCWLKLRDVVLKLVLLA